MRGERTPGLGGDPRRAARDRGALLARDVLIDRRREVLAGRERLVERLKRMAG